jgi:hypothetical protein
LGRYASKKSREVGKPGGKASRQRVEKGLMNWEKFLTGEWVGLTCFTERKGIILLKVTSLAGAGWLTTRGITS